MKNYFELQSYGLRKKLYILLCFACVYFFWRSIYRGWNELVDFNTFYYGTKLWLSQINPYDYQALLDISNDPNIARVINFPSFFISNIIFSILPYSLSEKFFTIANLAILIFIFKKILLFFKMNTNFYLLFLIVGLSMSSIHSTFYQGQQGIIITAFIIVAATNIHRTLLSGLLLALAASIKPQTMIFIPFLLLIFGMFKIFLSFVSFSALFLVTSLLWVGLDTLTTLLENINLFNNQSTITPDMSGAGNILALGSGAYVITDLRKLFHDLFKVNQVVTVLFFGLISAILMFFLKLRLGKVDLRSNKKLALTIFIFGLISAWLTFYNRYYNTVPLLIYCAVVIYLLSKKIIWPSIVTLFASPALFLPLFSIAAHYNIQHSFFYWVLYPSFNYFLIIAWIITFIIIYFYNNILVDHTI